MLTEKEAEEKLRGMAQEFQDLMKQRQYGKAKARYEVARSVAVQWSCQRISKRSCSECVAERERS